MSQLTKEPAPPLANSNNKRVRELVEAISDIVPEVRELQAEEQSLKARLRKRLKEFYWETDNCDGFTFDIPGQNGTLCQVNFVDKYFVNEDRYRQLLALGYTTVPDGFLVRSYNITINPQNLDSVKKVEFLAALKQLCERFGVNPGVEDYFGFATNFHAQRRQLCPEENEEIDAIVPMEVQVVPVENDED